jgi:hypothetical protein
MAAPQQISLQALAEFKAIYRDEFGEELSDAQANEIALGVLQLISVLVGPS